MAYADPFNVATPADTDITGQGDDRIREMKRAIQQRIESFFISFQNDPLIPKQGLIPVNTFFDDTFPGTKLIDGSVTMAKLSVADPIPSNLVNEDSILNLAVTRNKIADHAVNAGKIEDHTVGNLQLADDAVQTSNIKNKNVTGDKIADHTITALQLEAGLAAGRTTQLNGTYVFAGATIIAGAGTDYLQFDITNAAITALPLAGPALVEADLNGLNPAAAEWPDGLIFHAFVIGALGARQLRVRIKNTNTYDVDVSAKTIYWQINQAMA